METLNVPNTRTQPAVLDALRQRIAAIERRPLQFEGAAPGETEETAWRLGIDSIDTALPGGRLATDGLHDVRPQAFQDGAAAAGFTLALLARLPAATDRQARGVVLWCQNRRCTRSFGRLYGPGLTAFGLDPAQLIVLQAERDRDVLWAMEEGLNAGALALVVGELQEAGFTATRRLSLAAQERRVPALLLQDHAVETASAALTRWHVAARASSTDSWDPRAPGPARWSLSLSRCRGAATPPGIWDVEWNHETHRFRLAAALADRPAPARAVTGNAFRRTG